MTNRYLTLLGPSRISDTYNDINLAFDGIQGDFDNHVANNSGAHGATSAATANRLMQRDAQGRAKVAAPNASDDIARKAEVDAAITAAAMDASSKMASVHADLDAHTGNADIHTSAVEKTKLAGIAAGAEVNQNAFSKIGVTGQPDIVAGSKTDTVSIKGGTGITVSTNATSKEVTITATGTSTPGAHAASHITGGSDVIPDAVSGGASGLFSGVDKAKLDGMASGPDSTTDVMIGDRTANPALVPTGLTGKLTQWLSWFTNRIKAITGMTNWWDDPPATLSSLNTNKAPLNSPALTGTPTTPTAAVGTSTTQIASAQLVKASVDAHVAAADPHTQYAPKASPSFTGVVSSQSTATLGSNAGDTVELRKEIGSVNGNVSGLITRIRRAIAGTGWVNADVDILRRTDSTDQQRISFRGDGGMSIVGTAGGTLDLENNHLHVKTVIFTSWEWSKPEQRSTTVHWSFGTVHSTRGRED